LLTAIGESGPPLVLAGDLNERPGGPVWATLSERLEDAAAAVGDDGPTYSSDRPRRRIDAIFTDPRIVVERYAVLRTAATSRASDHLPLYAELKLP
jgi:endonuclease/exonuclease/phosphatase family metal-dependent hydrolase